MPWTEQLNLDCVEHENVTGDDSIPKNLSCHRDYDCNQSVIGSSGGVLLSTLNDANIQSSIMEECCCLQPNYTANKVDSASFKTESKCRACRGDDKSNFHASRVEGSNSEISQPIEIEAIDDVILNDEQEMDSKNARNCVNSSNVDDYFVEDLQNICNDVNGVADNESSDTETSCEMDRQTDACEPTVVSGKCDSFPSAVLQVGDADTYDEPQLPRCNNAENEEKIPNGCNDLQSESECHPENVYTCSVQEIDSASDKRKVKSQLPSENNKPENLQDDAQTLVDDLKLQSLEMNRLRKENDRLQQKLAANYEVIPLSETTADIYEVQMAALEKTITQLQREVDTYRDKLTEHDEISKHEIGNLRRELTTKLEKLSKRYETSEKDKEAMVVKYAQSEKNVFLLKKNQEEMERKLKENAREKEMLMGKVRSLTSERTRLNQVIDTKTAELNNLQKDCERLREESMSKDIKIKWAQNKLKTESDAHKETTSKLDKIQHKLNETREEAEQIRRDCQAMIRTYQESEEIKSNSLDLRLREKESELELERQEKSDQEEVYQMNKNELEALKKKHKLSIDENNALTMKVQSLERERLDYEQNLSKLKEQLNSGLQEIVDLQAKIAEMDNLTAQVAREKEKVVVNQTEIERLRQANVELQIDMEACRRKEGELLEFTERLTSKNVSLQSDFSCFEAKVQAQDRELNRVNKLVDELEQKNSVLAVQLLDEQQLRKQETQILARKLAEKTNAVENLNLKLDEQNNENKVIRRKNASSIRELTREVQTLRRRLDNYESRGGNLENHLGSRTSSTGSLDTLPPGSYNSSSAFNAVPKQSSAVLNGSTQVQESKTPNFIEPPQPPPVEPTRQMLIERIVKLQRAHARKNEKIDFLEEHVNQLLTEIKKKTKVIQNYVMRDDAGALSTLVMDQHKAELSKKGGIMASLYTSHQVDDGMTMELSLEISGKLQAVLEDTLLKNITLKENIKTLGDEIERLIKEKRQLKN